MHRKNKENRWKDTFVTKILKVIQIKILFIHLGNLYLLRVICSDCVNFLLDWHFYCWIFWGDVPDEFCRLLLPYQIHNVWVFSHLALLPLWWCTPIWVQIPICLLGFWSLRSDFFHIWQCLDLFPLCILMVALFL